MKKKLSIMMLLAALIVPWASRAQSDCTPISTFPVTYGFEASEGFTTTVTAAAACTTNVFNACWRNEETSFNSTSTATQGRIWHIYGGTSATYVHSGSGSLMLPDKGSSSAGVSTTMLVFPAMDFTNPSGYVVSFWIQRNGTGTSTPEGFKVYASTTDTIGPDAVLLGHYSRHRTMAYPVIESTTGWYQYETDPITLTGTVYIIFEGQSYYSSSTYVDDVVIMETPTCLRVTNLAVDASETTTSSLTLTWDDTLNTGAAYNVYMLGASDTTLVESGVYGNSYTVQGLNSGTSYTFAVVTDCGGNDTSMFSRTVTAYTACADITAADLPYTETFEDYTASSTAPISPCWTKGTNSSTAYPYVSTTAVSGSKSLYFYSNRASTATGTSYHSWVALPPIDENLQMNTLQVDFLARRYSTTTAAYHSMIAVGIAESLSQLGANMDSVTWVDTIDLTSLPASTITENEVTFDNYTGTGRYVVFYAFYPNFVSGTTQYNYIYLDDITLRAIPTCYRPAELVAHGLTSGSATLTWTPDSRTPSPSWVLEYGESGFVPGSGTTINPTDTTATITGLDPNTEYDAYVYASCGSDMSDPRMVTFRTHCTAISSLPYSNDFESEPYYLSGTTTYAEAFPECWFRINDATGTNDFYPYINTSSTYLINGQRSMYWYHTTTAGYAENEYAVLPEIDLSVFSLSEITLSFYAKTTATASPWPLFIVGVMNTPEDASTFVPVDTITLTSTAELYSVSFANYSGTGSYIAIRCPRTTSVRYCSLDDIYLTNDFCDVPENVSATATTDEVTLSWNTNGGDSFTVVFGEDTINGVSDSSYTFSDLTPNTAYSYAVATECSSSSSIFIEGTVRTLCVPVDSLPYFEGFEAYGNGATSPISPCWIKAAIDNTTAYPYPSSTAAITGQRGLYFYGYKSSTNARASYAALPLFTDELTDLFVEFDLKRYSSTSNTYHTQMQVGVMTDPNDISTFELLENIDLDNTPASSIHHYRVSLEYYTGNGQYIAFYAPTPTTNSHYNYVYLDNVNVDLLPTCRWPEGLTVDSIGAYDVRLAWMGSATPYEVEASTNAAFDTIVASDVVYDTFALLTGLDELSNYYFRVRGLCSGDSSLWSSTISARTTRDCGPNSINIIDTIGDGTSSSSTYTFHSSSSYRTGFSSTIYTIAELNGMGLQTNNRINGIKLHSGTTGGTIRKAKVYLKETTLDAIGSTVANDTVDRSTMTLVYSGNLVVPANSWVEILFDSAFTYSGNSNLLVNLCHDTNATAGVTFYYTTTSPDYLSLYGYRSTTTAAQNSVYRTYYRPNIVFDICTEVPTCMRPSGVAVTGMTDTSITLSWTHAADNYEVCVSTTPVDPDTLTNATFLTTDSTEYTITGLQPNTQYYMYVRSDCGSIGYSEWSIVTEGRTACTVMPVPFYDNFDSYTSLFVNTTSSMVGGMVPCWDYLPSAGGGYMTFVNSGTYLYGGSGMSLKFKPGTATSHDVVALPLFTLPISSLEMTFQTRPEGTSSSPGSFDVGYIANVADASTFVVVEHYDYSDFNGNYQEKTVTFAGAPATARIAFRHNTASAAYYWFVDEVDVHEAPSCNRPMSVSVNGVTATAANVHITDTTNVMHYRLYFDNGTAVDSVDIYDTTYTITTLQPSSVYTLSVRSLCAAGDITSAVRTSFATVCGQIALPVFFDPNNYTTGTTAALPNCWTRTNNSTGSYNYYPYIYSSSANAHSGSNTLYYYFSTSSGYSTDALMAFPEIDVTNFPMNNTEVIFWAKSSVANKPFMVGVMTNPAVASTFVAVDTITLTTTVSEYTVSLDNYTGNGTYIALRGVMSGTSSYYIYVDDIYIGVMSHCPRAYNLTAYNGTATGATLAWTDTIGSTQWVVEYHAYGDTVMHTVTANNNPFTLTGLTANTIYNYRVAPICSDGVQADWSRETFAFATSQVPATVPYSYDFENGTEWANWQTLSNNTVNWSRGNAVGHPGYSMYLSTDSGATRSYNMSAITNAAVYRDFDFGPTPVSYELTYDALIGGSTDGNYDGITIMVVDPAVIPVSSSTGLTSPWGHISTVDARLDTVWSGESYYLDGMQGVKRLVFFHFNQATASSHPFVDSPDAIDNIAIGVQPCARPYNLTADNITEHSAQLSWAGPATDTYIVAYRVYGAAAATNVYATVTGNSYVLNGLNSNTGYVYWVDHICSMTATDTLASDWSDGLRFSTECSASTLPYIETFDSVAGTTYNTAGVLPDCWQAYSNGTNSVYMPHVVSSGSYWYSVNSSPSLTMTSGSDTYGDTKIVALPLFDAPVSSCGIRFYYRHENASNGTLEIGYVTSPDLAGTFHPLVALPATTTLTQIDSTLLSAAPANATRIALRWTHNASFYSVGIDNIEVWSNGPVCNNPTSLHATAVAYNSVSVAWSGTDSAEVGIHQGLWDETGATIATVTTSSYTFTGLTPNMQYTIAVRKLCEDNMTSDWVYLTVTTDDLPCFAPSNIQVSNETTNGGKVTWTPGGDETEWIVNVFRTGVVDTNITVINTPMCNVSGLYADMSYTISVASVCGGIDTVWCDTTATLTTTACLPPATVTAVANGRNAIVTWEGSGANEYHVLWFVEGFTTGADSVVVTNGTTNATIEDLEPGESYDIYVYAYCDGQRSAQAGQAHVTITGIDDVNSSLINLYPNPANTTVTVDGIEGEALVTIVDMNGRTVFSEKTVSSITIDLGGMAKGAYFVRITGENSSAIRKLIVK